MGVSFDLIVVGHQTIDEISLPGQPTRKSPGGAVIFASLTAAGLGMKTAIVSRVGGDFPEEYVCWLSRRGVCVDWLVRDGLSKTSRFEIQYREGLDERCLRLITRCSDILPEDMPANGNARAIHLGSVAGEISLETAKSARKISSLLSVDLQGCVREFDSGGELTLTKEVDPRLFELVDIVKVSQNELTLALCCETPREAMGKLNLRSEKILVVTRGKRGATILRGDETVEMPAYPLGEVRDPTGAGDAFMGAFVSELARGASLSGAAAMGSAAASIVVEGVGPSSFGTRQEVSERARYILGHLQ